MLLVVACMSAFAVTPLSPHFTPDTRTRLFQALERVRVPAVGQNSVAIAMLSALGPRPHSSSYGYDEPYAHLPKVSVSATVRTPVCVVVSVAVRGDRAAGYRPVRVTGEFCLVAQSEWQSDNVHAEAVVTP